MKKKRDFLNFNELRIIEGFNFYNERLDRVRDLVIFSCYTGIGFSEISKLNFENVLIGLEGKKWTFTSSNKTKIKVKILLLYKALEIIEKYQEPPMTDITKSLLPLITNVKVNPYLKEIAELFDIRKKLNFSYGKVFFCYQGNFS